MDINYISKWLSFWLFFACAMTYLFHFLKYSGYFSQENTKLEIKLFKIIGFCHLMIAIQMLVGLYYVLKLNPPIASAHVGFSGLSILVLSVLKLKAKLQGSKLEAALALLGFVFLSFHIL